MQTKFTRAVSSPTMYVIYPTVLFKYVIFQALITQAEFFKASCPLGKIQHTLPSYMITVFSFGITVECMLPCSASLEEYFLCIYLGFIFLIVKCLSAGITCIKNLNVYNCPDRSIKWHSANADS